jgi:hypothetical protein
MSIRALAVLFSLALVFAFAGCSGGTPVTTDLDGQVAQTLGTIGSGVLMSAKIHLDTNTMTAEVVPTRLNSAIGNLVGDLEVASFFVYPFCPDATCLYVKGLGIIAGTPPKITVTVGVAHPFKPHDPSKPPTAANRSDLDIFDARVYLVNDGGTTPNPEKKTISGLATGDIVFTPGFVVGADGYDDGADGIIVNAGDGLSAEETQELTQYRYTGSTNMQPYMRIFDGTVDAFAFVPGSTPAANDNRLSHGEVGETMFTLALEPGAGAIDFDVSLVGSYGAAALGNNKPSFHAPTYMKAYRTTRPFIALQTPATTDGATGVSNPKLNFQITHAWAGLTAAADKATYEGQANNGNMLPPGAKGPGTADLTFKCRLDNGTNVYDFAVLPTATGGDGIDATPWLFSLDLADPAVPANPIANGTYKVYIYVLADTGSYSADYPFAVGDNYTLFYADGLVIQTV